MRGVPHGSSAQTKTPPSLAGSGTIRSWEGAKPARRNLSSGGDALFGFRRLAQHIAAAPDGLDVVLALRRIRELLAQLADEHVDDLQFGLVHAAVEMVEEHLLGQRRALAER